MRNGWAVAKREFFSYFVTPIGYVVVGIFTAITGLGFAASFLFYAEVSVNPTAYAYSGVPDFEETLLSPLMVFCGMLVMFIGPLVTMRLLAEEKNRGTLELLFTYPLRDREIIFGKYLAALGMLWVMVSVLGVHVALLAYYVDVEKAVLAFGLLSVFLMGSAFMSIGLFISSITGNQVTAGTLTFGLSFISYVLGVFAERLSSENPAPAAWHPQLQNVIGWGYAIFRSLLQELPLDVHAKNMSQGIVEPKDIVYYLLVIAFFLFLTFRALESRRWRAGGGS